MYMGGWVAFKRENYASGLGDALILLERCIPYKFKWLWCIYQTCMYLVLVCEVSDETVGVIVLLLVKRGEEGEVRPITIGLVTHVITNPARQRK